MNDPLDDGFKPPEVHVSASGNLVLEHQRQERPFQPAVADPLLHERIAAHIERYVGKIHQTFGEITSDLVHIYLHWVQPTEDLPFHTFITSGMSQHPMHTPPEVPTFRYAEVLLSLPDDWPIGLEEFKDAAVYWPIRLLKGTARFPHEYRTWIGPFHTISNGDPAAPYDDSTQLSAAFILHPFFFEEAFWQLPLEDERVINFYNVLPIYNEERAIKFQQGGQALLRRLLDNDVLGLVEPQRINVGTLE